MLSVDVRGLHEASARLFDRRSRLIGWGSGSVFDYFQRRHPLRLEYLVDNERSRWGTRAAGLEIAGPSRLLSEDPARTFVVIYSSAWPEIARQLRELGGFESIPATAAFADADARERLDVAERLAARDVRRAPRPERSIVVQGPVVPAVTVRVLRALGALHPTSRIVLSTWDDTDPSLLDAAIPNADDVVLSPRPAVPGIQNRNCQLISTRLGIERAVQSGARTILKTRTDLVPLAPQLFEQAAWWLSRVHDGRAQRAGLRDRLIVPSSYTRKFLLYHPSDLLMLGTAGDMLRYWSAPLDPRSGTLMSAANIDAPVAAVNMSGNPTESYLGLQFCRSLGRTAAGTLEDSWRFYRDFFAVVGNSWFDLLWFKNLSIPDAAVRAGVRETVSPQFWQRLHADDPTVAGDAASVDIQGTALRALAGAA